MKKTILITIMVFAVITVTMSVSDARRSYLGDVNNTCGTNYGCGVCHVDPSGGGALNSGGDGYVASGYDSCYFCANSASCAAPTCTDRDGDGYFAEGGACGPVDCNDTDASIHPGACDVLRDGIDQDCSGKDRLKGKPCK